ncbi:hypothetical protein BJF79_30255 [Actinomadura sp. CNU-125]|uniref:hypothetical protein n=1 Tax=Actinomadura sp. CNU-125 TaxID=1904961 RepID=UPI000961A088|nr:hypothetical protein [Actinomadura sp. CNU-125]OLT37075.1 hypothetical protein BJF79_30255 [Actinomadura sp. CNU-125]
MQTLVAQFAWTNDPKAIGTDADLVTGYTTLANALDVFQYFTLVVGIAAIVAFGWGERWVAIRPMMVGVVGVFAFAALVIKSIIGFLLVALVPGMLAESMTDPLGLLQQLFLWILPTCYVAGSAWSSCRAAAVRGFRVRES